jgi:hypothetical protein
MQKCSEQEQVLLNSYISYLEELRNSALAASSGKTVKISNNGILFL